MAAPDMVPPVALLAYPKDAPEQAFFWPFATFSPEYQAVLWAIRNGVPVRFIDLPVAWRLPQPIEVIENSGEVGGSEHDPDPIRRDPIGALARAAGYEDGESWWRDVIEENPDPGPIFSAVADAMSALRETETELPKLEAAREAHMRLEIATSAKSADGVIAVVCGAWHVPALKAKHTAKDDRALLKGAPKAKITATWAPWTAPRLAFTSGYGAGVAAPGWCKHLWETPGRDQTTKWVTKIARALRDERQIVSTASLIETERLSVALAAVRGRPRPGFEELRDATVSCLCYGDPILWRIIEAKLLLGDEVGEIPENVPSAPLLEDLQRQQKKARLKPEALDRELSLDLRTDSGLFRSTLLHRLVALNVGWGRMTDAGKSRGTFREKWELKWESQILDLTEQLADPVDVLFGVQLGGGTDINQAVAYCEDRIEKPSKSHLVLITDLYEGGNAEELLARVARLIGIGVNVIVLLALSDSGRPFYDPNLSEKVAALGAPVFACTPDQFSDLMAAALRREDIHRWAAKEDIKLVSAGGEPL